MVMVFFIVLISAAAFFSGVDGVNIRLEREKQNIEILSEAKAALIGYALQNPLKPGTLPCTDSDNDGSVNKTLDDDSCVANIGRLPWKDLGLSMLKDKDGECLWYALSPVFRNTMTAATRAANPLNITTSGTITLVDDTDNPLAGINPVIAVLIAPGAAIAEQSRSTGATTNCPGDSNAANYLDTKGGVNNATGNVATNDYTFKLGKLSSTFDDQFTYITAKEFKNALRIRMVKEILGNTTVHSGPVDYYDTNTNYPCPAATVIGNQDCTLSTGFVPYNDPGLALQYAALGSWLTTNGWFTSATYAYFSPTHVKLTLADPFGSYSCDANANIFTCSSP